MPSGPIAPRSVRVFSVCEMYPVESPEAAASLRTLAGPDFFTASNRLNSFFLISFRPHNKPKTRFINDPGFERVIYTISSSSLSRSMYFLSGVRLASQYSRPPQTAVYPLPVRMKKIGLLISAVRGL